MDRETIKFIKSLKDYIGILPKQTIKTLRGQALQEILKEPKKALRRE